MKDLINDLKVLSGQLEKSVKSHSDSADKLDQETKRLKKASQTHSKQVEKIKEMLRKIKMNEDYSDEEMVIKTLERINELSEIIRNRILDGERTRSWQESKVYVILDNLESVMSGFPVRRDKNDIIPSE